MLHLEAAPQSFQQAEQFCSGATQTFKQQASKWWCK